MQPIYRGINMTTISEIYINALLADATYAIDESYSAQNFRLESTLSTRMTATQAKFIAENFEIDSHFESDDVWGSGFDAVAWKGKEGTAYENQVYLSMQGTAGFADFLADIDLAINSAARAQYADIN